MVEKGETKKAEEKATDVQKSKETFGEFHSDKGGAATPQILLEKGGNILRGIPNTESEKVGLYQPQIF